MHSPIPTKGVKFKFDIGERVLCYEPDPAKSKVLYESKVLDLVAGQDVKGKRRPEYLVHFFGWSNSWDRCIREDWVLPLTDENQDLQRRLAEQAAIYLRGSKNLPILKDTLSKNISKAYDKPEPFSDPDSSDSSEDEAEKQVIINIPEVLKLQLEEDWCCITKKNKLVAIPCYPNVVAILEGFVKHSAVKLFYGSTPRHGRQCMPDDVQDKLGLYKETADGLRVSFDFTLPHLLLYGHEKKQHYSHCSTARPHRDKHEIAPTSLKVEPPSSDSEYTPVWEPVFIKQEPPSPESAPKRGRPRKNMPKNITTNTNPIVEPMVVCSPVVEPGISPVVKKKAGRKKAVVAKATTSKKRGRKPVAKKKSAVSAKANLKEKMIQKRKKGRPKSLPTRILRSSHKPIRNSRLPVKKKPPVVKKKKKRPKKPFPLPIIIKTEPGTSLCEDRITRRGSVQARIAMENHAAVKNNFCTPTSVCTPETSTPDIKPFSNQLTNKTEPSSFEKRITRQRSVHIAIENQFMESPFHPPIERPVLLPSPCSLVNSCSTMKMDSSSSFNGVQGISFPRLKGMLSDTLGWKMLPEHVWEIVPAEPSLIYGAQHLLRLFVKLPDLISKMRISNRKRQLLLDILNQFLAYMLEQKELLFPPTAYVDCPSDK